MTRSGLWAAFSLLGNASQRRPKRRYEAPAELNSRLAFTLLGYRRDKVNPHIDRPLRNFDGRRPAAATDAQHHPLQAP